MNGSTHAKFKPSLLLSALLGGIILTSCGSKEPMANLAASKPAEVPAPMATPAAQDLALKSSSESGQAQSTATAPRSRPQLIKTVKMSLSVNSIDQTFQAISKILKQQQGDIFKFEDNKPQNNSTRHTASMEIKVPQEQLDATLDELAKLGTVQHRTQTAEDVTDQLVDSQARLRNLRQQETTLLKIMERQGSVEDLLRVTQELSNVRENIERLDAQLKSLRDRVAYSTITLKLEEAIAGKSYQRPLVSEVQENWDKATTSVGKLTVGLIGLSLWFIAFSPYFLILGGAVFAYNRLRKLQSQPPAQASEPPKSR